MRENASERHHKVPKHYLDNFAKFNEKSLIYTYDKKSPSNVIGASTKKTANQKDFYAFIDKEGKISNKFEELICISEDKGIPVLNKIINAGNLSIITEQEKADLSTYIAMMIVRTESFRRRAAEVVTSHHLLMCREKAKDPEEFRIWMESYEKKIRDKMSDDVLEQVRQSFITPEEIKIGFGLEWTLRGLGAHDDFLPVIYEMNWSLLVSSDDTFFLTSDNPVHVGGGLDTRFGSDSLSFFMFPLSPKYMLWGHFGSHDEKIFISEKSMPEINNNIVTNVDRYIYSHSKKDDIKELVERFKDIRPTHTVAQAQYGAFIDINFVR